MRTLTPAQARQFLVGHHGLRAPLGEGVGALDGLLARLRCIQLDPLDPFGTNADLVAMARIDGLKRGDVYSVLGTGAFEHWAKERCMLPASAFPYYRDRVVETPWWRLGERYRKLPDGILGEVLDEVTERGALTAAELDGYGSVEQLDYSGWKSTPRAATLAIKVLWTRCEVVVCGRRGKQKLYDLPRRALPEVHALERAHEFERWALLERVEAAGLLSTATGPHWSMLADVRKSSLPDELVEEGLLERVTIEGSRREYFAPGGFMDRVFPEDDGQMRILGPLDPLIWDRKLVQHAFDFEYIWEVYKPAATRRWGYYVVPLLHHGQLVGRFDAHIDDGALIVDNVWREENAAFDEAAFATCVARHAEQVCNSAADAL